jgi:hypothetical protein
MAGQHEQRQTAATVTGIRHAGSIQARLRAAASVPEALAAGFAAFEVIRLAARAHEDQVPRYFAAFMTAADAAVTGREALTIAPSMPAIQDAAEPGGPGPEADVDAVADTLAALGALLAGRLTRAAALARTPDDRAACEEAAGAARQICHLMARGHDDRRLR